ncbi:MAG: transcription elongation factor GreA [Coprobacillus sp.]|nr:transcription elongation factor GreA [Coprobacillus sp.]
MANEKKIQLTKEGYDNLQAELRQLLDVEQPAVKEQLSEARSQGDLSENADYDAARNRLSEIEDRIKTIEYNLANSVIVKGKSNKVALGSTVEIEFLSTHARQTFLIVGTVESDISKGKLSNDSPVGRAIMDKQVGDEVEIEVAKPYKIKIVSITTD